MESAHHDPELEQLKGDAWQLSMLPIDHEERVQALVDALTHAPDVEAGVRHLLALRSDVELRHDYAQLVVVTALEWFLQYLLHRGTGIQAQLHGPRLGIYLMAAKTAADTSPDQL